MPPVGTKVIIIPSEGSHPVEGVFVDGVRKVPSIGRGGEVRDGYFIVEETQPGQSAVVGRGYGSGSGVEEQTIYRWENVLDLIWEESSETDFSAPPAPDTAISKPRRGQGDLLPPATIPVGSSA